MKITAMQETIKAALAQVSLAMDIAQELSVDFTAMSLNQMNTANATHAMLHVAQNSLRYAYTQTENI